MGTRATSRSASPKKPSKPNEGGSAAPGTSSSRTRGAAAAGAAPEKVDKAAAEKGEKAEKPAKKAPQEVLSLIDEKKPRARRTQEQKPISGLMPAISKILAPAPEPEAEAPAPEPEPEVEVAPVEAAAEAPVEMAAEEAEAEVSDSKIVHLKPPIVVKDLAAAIGLKPFQIIKDLMDLNIFANINQVVDPEVAAKVCTKHGFVFEREKREKGQGVHKPEPVAPPPKEPEKPKPAELELRAPIITFMGHVDHGKTSLMDAIRKTRVAQGEEGGITQHIGAYSVERKGQRITFLDTPGHEAFTAMRARGANVTDIVVLVVAADDGLMPQTIEAINHAKAAKVAIIVAINKIDLPGANVDRVKTQLQERGLAPEDWGGETIVCPVSALKGDGIDHLLEMLLLQAEVLELKASPGANARGTVIEAQIEPGRGPTGTVIIREGTLKVGQAFICGNHFGKVKALIDAEGNPIKVAGPSTPAKVLGFAGMPNAGDELVVMDNERAAKALGEERQLAVREQKLMAPQRATLENLFATLADGQKPKLNMVLKCDVQGSLEAITNSLKQIDSKKVDLEIIHSGVGPISESDVLLATASNAVVIGFSTKTENTAAAAAKREQVQIKLYSIIYELIDQVKDAMAGLLEPETRESVVGHAEVRKVFDLTRGRVAGCLVTNGRIVRNLRARVLRGKQPIYDGGFATLRRFQEDVKEVRNGLECGIRLGDFTEYQSGDIVECYQLEKIPQKL